jgi:superfamily I DNA/RNA helicase
MADHLEPAAAPDPMIAARDAATDEVVNSPHRRRVIVAGPGTGKSTTFKKALVQRGGRGLALTFLRLLADDLRKSLIDCADGYTFHGFAKRQMKVHTPAGLSAHFEIYPPLVTLEMWDFHALGIQKIAKNPGAITLARKKAAIENPVQKLDFTGGVPQRVLDLGSYYDAAGFPDLTLRMYLDQKDHPEHIPTFPLIVVDEYQDFSPLETAIIDQLGTESHLLIAGDDDQALYDWRAATADAIRTLAADPASERHSLPYCSRCTSVIVDAVIATIRAATAIGKLPGRLNKPFECYTPTKGPDNEAHPKIFDVRCTHSTYMKRYVAARITEIPQEDIKEAAREGHPTVLVIGPRQFLNDVVDHLREAYPDARRKPSDALPVLPVHGYRYLARDVGSNLGWRIVVEVMRPAGWEACVRDALETGEALVDHLDSAFRDEHLAVAALLARGLKGELDHRERDELATHLRVAVEELDKTLELAEETEPTEEDEGVQEQIDTIGPDIEPDEVKEEAPLQPTITFTSLVGAKGLSAAYVFVVGCSNGHFPRHSPPSDVEICEFIVALSRTRKACHLVSCAYLGQEALAPSDFLTWVRGQTTVRRINKTNVPG